MMFKLVALPMCLNLLVSAKILSMLYTGRNLTLMNRVNLFITGISGVVVTGIAAVSIYGA